MSSAQFDRRIRRSYRKRFNKMVSVPAGSARSSDQLLSEIAELAEYVGYCHGDKIPCDLQRIAAESDITISVNDYGNGFDAMLEHFNGLFHIYCNSRRVGAIDSGRGRFSLAHELGHYFIDSHRNALASGRAAAHCSNSMWQSHNVAERQADCFAAHLLMPTASFTDLAASGDCSLQTAMQLADFFDVSLTAAALRMVETAASTKRFAILLKWQFDTSAPKRGQLQTLARSSAPVKLAWKKFSPAAARVFAQYSPAKNPPSQSATEAALTNRKNNSDISDGIKTSHTLASQFFADIAADSSDDKILREQAVSLGRFGAVTLLTGAG